MSTTHLENIPEFIFLGGTTKIDENDPSSNWRETLCKNLTVDYFNPVVKEWTDKAKYVEDNAKRLAAYHVYVITPYFKGGYGFCELTKEAIESPKTTFVLFLDCDKKQFDKDQVKSNNAILDLLKPYGVRSANSLSELCNMLNSLK